MVTIAHAVRRVGALDFSVILTVLSVGTRQRKRCAAFMGAARGLAGRGEKKFTFRLINNWTTAHLHFFP